VTKEERELKRQALQSKPSGFVKFSPRLEAKLNAISLKYFEGKYRFKPSYTSMINFAKKNPSEKRIDSYLKSKVFQDKYSEFN
jgi:hypothetical protein